MHIHKAPLGKEGVNGLRRQRADAEHGAEGVGACAQMRLRAQIFKGVPLFLQGIFGAAQTDDLHLLRLDFKGLLHGRGQNQPARNFQRRAQRDLYHVPKVGKRFVADDLDVFEKGAVVELDKGERLAVPQGAHPAAYGHLRAVRRGMAKQISQFHFHR